VLASGEYLISCQEDVELSARGFISSAYKQNNISEMGVLPLESVLFFMKARQESAVPLIAI